MMIKYFILFIALIGYPYLPVAQEDMVVFSMPAGVEVLNRYNLNGQDYYEIEYLYVNPGDEICAEYQLGNHESWGRIYTVCTTVG